jgi:HK97 family phage portal protein
MDQSQLAWQALRAARDIGWTWAPVTPDVALKVPAVSACVHAIAGSVSTLPLFGQALDDGRMVNMDRLPRLWREPSADLPLEDWVYTSLQSMMLDGTSWGRIVARDARLSPTQVELMPAEVVTWRRDKQNGVIEIRFDGQPVPSADVWHVSGIPSRSHPFGVSLSERAAAPIQVQIAARQYLGDWFASGAHPTSVVTLESNPGAAGAAEFKQRLMSIMRGSREPLVVAKGTTIAPFQVAPADSAVADALKQSATDIATFFLSPPEMVGGSTGDSMTYANVEQQQIQFLQRAVRFWMTKLERAMSRAVAPQRIRCRFDENELVRTDLKTKFDAITQAVGGPWLTVDEGREMDDRAPMPQTSDAAGPQQARAVAELIQKIYLGVGVMLSADEAREIANAAGASLQGPYAAKEG